MNILKKEYKLNYEISSNIYEKLKRFIRLNECYDNVAKVVLLSDKFNIDISHMKVAFGMWLVEPNVYTRHCFFLLDDMVIDPTYFVVKKEELKDKDTLIFEENYLIFNTFNINIYIQKLINGELSHLPRYNNDLYLEMENKIVKAGIKIC